MVGNITKDEFDPEENYDHFYTHHKFEPFPEDLAFNCDEVLPRAAWTLDTAREQGYKSVLDLCCLDGFVSLTLGKKLGMKVVGVDLSKPGIEIAQERAEKATLDARYYQDTVEEYLLHCGQRFDMILHFEAVEHYKDTILVMQRCKKLLNPGGSILISTPDLDGKYGDTNEDACHLRVYSHKPESEIPESTSLGKPVISLPAEIEMMGGTIVENEVWNDLIHLRTTFN